MASYKLFRGTTIESLHIFVQYDTFTATARIAPCFFLLFEIEPSEETRDTANTRTTVPNNCFVHPGANNSNSSSSSGYSEVVDKRPAWSGRMATCSPGYPVLGMQPGEELATMLRLFAFVISMSVFFPWLSSQRRAHMRIFFLHWASGVMYVLSQFIMSVMVLNCWSSKDDAGPFIYFLKFWELTVLNLWSISSLAIALLIANIVKSFAKMRRVPP
ncbi:unnamed protein product, partial [Pylaiella littoralis]